MRSTRFRRALAAPIVLVALASATSCGGDSASENSAEKAIERASGGDADVDIDGEEVEIKTSEGTVSMGKDKLPDGFPDDIPVVDGEIMMSMGAADQGYQVTLNVDDADAAFDEASGELEDAGFSKESDTEMMGGKTASFTRDEQTVILSTSGDDDLPTLSYTVALS